jgi:integrase
MARAINRLSARGVQAVTKPGRHSDGAGLYLVVDQSGAKRWVFLFKRSGRMSEMGLGGLLSVPLSRAREVAAQCRMDLASGRNPILLRRTARQQAPGVPTFGQFADLFVRDMSPQWRNEKHRAQWRMTLTVYCAPMRSKPVSEITTDDVLAVLKPIWTSKPETASRLRGRIERVLDAAGAKRHRSGDNPARWRGNFDHLLPKRSKLSKGHHAAMPYANVPKFISDLRERDAVAALALEFTILTAARSGETLNAQWGEIEHDKKLWTVPGERMKAGREHRVPLTSRALEILEIVGKIRDAARPSEFVFPGQKPGKPLSNMALEMMLRRMKITDATVHGFRSSFRDWCGNQTDFPREIAEACLAHVVGNATEQAYRRGDALDKRRTLMDAWAAYCGA